MKIDYLEFIVYIILIVSIPLFVIEQRKPKHKRNELILYMSLSFIILISLYILMKLGALSYIYLSLK